jgi:hypothetical protein
VRNPARRNRNIGTAKQGRGQDNRFVIPQVCRQERDWTELLGPHHVRELEVAGREVVFVVEENTAGCIHACTVEDIGDVLSHIPSDDWTGLQTFVLRQSTRKQRLLQPAWGRLIYQADLRGPAGAPAEPGPTVLIEAFDPAARIRWSLSLDPDDRAELERLEADGHDVARSSRGYEIRSTLQSVRNTQLCRTLLHEIGHWVDYLQKVERPADAGEDDYSHLVDLYFARPKHEREAFAHRYADELGQRLQRGGVLPPAPIPCSPAEDAEVMQSGES